MEESRGRREGGSVRARTPSELVVVVWKSHSLVSRREGPCVHAVFCTIAPLSLALRHATRSRSCAPAARVCTPRRSRQPKVNRAISSGRGDTHLDGHRPGFVKLEVRARINARGLPEATGPVRTAVKRGLSLSEDVAQDPRPAAGSRGQI